MKLYSLHTKQNLPISLEKAWDFLSDPFNLKRITPDYMKFDLLSRADDMYEGQILEYLVSPIANITMKWVTEITHVKKGHYFIDEQRFGPYSFWHHKHFLREIDGGVEMEDLLHYKLPMGFIGQMAHPFLVEPKLKEIFDYRQNALTELFGTYKPTNQTINDV